MICKGVVKDNVVLLKAGVQLPNGAEVEVRLLERPLTRQEVFARVRTHRIDYFRQARVNLNFPWPTVILVKATR